MQLNRDPGLSRGYLSARSVMGFLADVYSTAADEIGKISMIADDKVFISFYLVYLFTIVLW